MEASGSKSQGILLFVLGKLFVTFDANLLIFYFTDVNECLLAPCGFNSNCTNTNGSYICECHTGYERNGKNCEGKVWYLSIKYLQRKPLIFLSDGCNFSSSTCSFSCLFPSLITDL